MVQPWLRFHIPLIEPGLVDFSHPALGQDLTPSPTARRAQAGTGVRAQSARKGALSVAYHSGASVLMGRVK